MEAQDIIQNEEGDLMIANGDFIVGASDEQHVKDIILAHRGWYKEFPFIGVGLQSYLKSAGMEQELKTAIQLQLESDNYQVNQIIIGDINKSEIAVDATRSI